MDKAFGPDVNAFPPMAYCRQLCMKGWKSVQLVTSLTQRNDGHSYKVMREWESQEAGASNECYSCHDS